MELEEGMSLINQDGHDEEFLIIPPPRKSQAWLVSNGYQGKYTIWTKCTRKNTRVIGERNVKAAQGVAF